MGKFKGGSDDWLDDEDSSSGRAQLRAPKKGKPTVDFLEIDQSNGTVVEVFPNQCVVLGDEPKDRFACTYRKAKMPNAEARERSPVAVGDRVRFEKMGSRDGVIDGISRRRNMLARPAPERAMRHVLSTNVDRLVIVAACAKPEFSPGLVDRFWVAAQSQEIQTILVVNKIDLFEPGDRPWTIYTQIGLPTIEISTKTGMGIDQVDALIRDGVSVFCGHSGVGKTSLLNRLSQREIGRTGEISEATGKGQHTTTGAYFIPGTSWIDTPGVREFGLLDVQPEELKKFFPEMQGLACEVEDCLHEAESGCAAKSLFRYASYRRILESLRSPDA